MKRLISIHARLLSLVALVLVWQDGSANISQSDTVASKQKIKTIVIPAIIHSPETKWGFGLGSSIAIRSKKSDSNTRTSNLQALLLHTTRSQNILGLNGTIFFPHENYILRLHSSFTYFPDKYWGLGNRTDSRKAETFSYKQYYIFPQLLRRVYKDLYVGVTLEYQRVFRILYDKNNFYDNKNLHGLGGGIIPGVGLLTTWDSRNNAFSPTMGTFLEFSFTNFENRTKGFHYSNYTLDFRKYIETSRRQVVAFQIYGNFNRGNVPIIRLAAMGGSSIMRGYYSGRFRDNNMIAAQVEYRMHIYKAIGFVGFAGVGQVTYYLEDLGFNQFKGAVGGGLRVALKPEERLNLRIDYGVARHSSGFYFTVAEAF